MRDIMLKGLGALFLVVAAIFLDRAIPQSGFADFNIEMMAASAGLAVIGIILRLLGSCPKQMGLLMSSIGSVAASIALIIVGVILVSVALPALVGVFADGVAAVFAAIAATSPMAALVVFAAMLAGGALWVLKR